MEFDEESRPVRAGDAASPVIGRRDEARALEKIVEKKIARRVDLAVSRSTCL